MKEKAMTNKRKKVSADAGHRKQPREGDKSVSSGRFGDLPPNENLKKMPDEVYGDTEIPPRRD